MGHDTPDERGYEYCTPTPAPALDCPICREPLVNPVHTPCDHHFCRSCLSQSLALSLQCPVDRTPLPAGLDSCSKPARVVVELLDELRIRCEACGDEMARGEWTRHRGKCGAGAAEETNTTREGSDDECTTREGSDDDSRPAQGRAATPAAERDASDPTASSSWPSPPPECTYCLVPLPRSLPLASHLLTTCPLAPTPCPLAALGCPTVLPRHLLATHEPECAYAPLERGLQAAKDRAETVEGENWALRRRVERLEGTVEALVDELRALRSALGDFVAPPSSSSPLSAFSPAPAPNAASLPAAVSALSTTFTSHTSALSALAHAHAHQASQVAHVKEDQAALHAALGGVRMQLGGVAMEVEAQRMGLGQGGAYGMYPRPGYGLRRGMSGGPGAGGGSDDDDLLPGSEAGASPSGSDDEPPFPPRAFAHLAPPFSAYAHPALHPRHPPHLPPPTATASAAQSRAAAAFDSIPSPFGGLARASGWPAGMRPVFGDVGGLGGAGGIELAEDEYVGAVGRGLAHTLASHLDRYLERNSTGLVVPRGYAVSAEEVRTAWRELLKATEEHDWVKAYEEGMIGWRLFPGMCAGEFEACVLQHFALMSKAKRVLEIGVFTGTTTLALALLPSVQSVTALDLEPYLRAFVAPYWERAGVASKIDYLVAPALDSLDRLAAEGAEPFEMVFSGCG
ncbi:hypothetical protein JCM10207_007197 [Rhodosporidiobolus poonsookiae]